MTSTSIATVERFLAGTHSPDIADLDVIDETVSPAILCHGFPGFPGGEFKGRENYKAFFRTFRESFSDMTFETLAILPQGDFVSAHWRVEARFTGPFNGIAPDNRPVVFDGVALYRIKDGLIAETWLTVHMPMLMAQLPAAA